MPWGIDYSSNFYEFTNQVVWFVSVEREGEKHLFLAFLMARGPRVAYEHARCVFWFYRRRFS